MFKATSPIDVFLDLNGDALDSGYIYFGEFGENPITDPITVYWDEAGTQPVSQPVRTSGGYIVRSGTPANVFTSERYSILVQDSTTSLVFYGSDSNNFDVSTNILDQLASSAGASLIGSISPLSGAIQRTLQAELNDDLKVTQFGADPTGVLDSTSAINAAIAAMPNPCMLKFPKGTYKITSEITLPYTGVNGSGKTLHFDGCTLSAAANNITLLHWSESRCATTGRVKFIAGAFTGVSGLRVTPESEGSTTVLANQNFNSFAASMEFGGGLAETVVLQTGPRVTGTDSGCFYNQFTGDINVTSCKRGPWLKDGNLGANAGCNSNYFANVIVNGSVNTGFQVDSGGGNEVGLLQLENITLGSSPNATPTGLIVMNTMINGNSNNDNIFRSVHWENCTLTASIGNTSTQIYVSDSDLLNCMGTVTPYTEQYRRAYPQKGTIINSIFNTVTSPANIRGLWFFDEFGGTSVINDRSTKGHPATLRDASLVAQNANLWGPYISGNAFGLTYGDESHLWDVANNADFNFGDGATDSPFSIVTLIYPTLASSCEVVSKDSLTSGSEMREFAIGLETSGSLSMFLFDNSAGSYIARTAPGGSLIANALQTLTTTYDGSGTAAGIKIYANTTRVDNATMTFGVYTAMEALTAKPAGYRLSSAGVPERFFKGRLFVTMIVAEALTQVKIQQLSYLLRSYAGTTLA